MKYILSLGLIAINLASLGQNSDYNLIPDKGTYMFDRESSDDNLRVEEVIWSQDFSQGIPVVWNNVNMNSNNQMTTAQWEYRGVSTTPNVTLGTRGNCLDPGLEGGLPILSPTADNGFIIFDSDYWDSSEGGCGEFGTGISAAPHSASLTTGAFNFEDRPFVGLIFNQFLRNFESSFRVQASANGGAFQDIYVSPITGVNSISERDMQVRKNMSEIAGGQPNVRIRFLFEGTYYFWMLDDLMVVALEENNLTLSNARHGSFTIEDAAQFESYEGLQYFKYPLSMMNALELSARGENLGGQTQTGVNLTVTLNNDEEELETVQSMLMPLDPEDAATFEAPNIVLPPDVGSYTLTYDLLQTQDETSPEDNSVNRTIDITESTLARDEGVTDAFYIPDNDHDDIQYEVGTVYLPTEQNLQLYSISGAVSSSTLTGSHCYAKLYGISADNGLLIEPIATTPLQVVQFFHLNSFGDDQMMVFDFESPIELASDSTYLAVIGTIDTAEEVTFAVSGESQPLTSWAIFSNNDINYLDRIPMVRLNFDQVTSVEEENNPTATFSVRTFPNPASEKVVVEYKLDQTSELLISLFDIQGKHIEDLHAGIEPSGINQLEINVSSLATGTYMIRLISEYGKLEEAIVIE